MPISIKELDGIDSMLPQLEAQGLTNVFLAKQLKAELKSKKTILQKIKGAVGVEQLPKTKKGQLKKGIRIIATSGTLSYDKEGAKVFGDGDTLLAIDEIDWQTRQRARQDAHRLRGDYPPEKLLHGLTGKDGEVIDHIPIVLVGSPDVPINSEVQALMDGTDK